MKYVLAIDSFKGCLSSAEAEAAVASALRERGGEVVALPMSDGGEGMLEAFTAVLKGRLVDADVHDPLMRPITAPYGITPDGTAIIETSKACGLTLMKEEERNPLKATTYGVGELIAHAVRNGCRRFIVGLGGSGTSDAGMGMLEALAYNFSEAKSIDEISDSFLKDCRFTLACDVRNPLCGPEGAAYTFARQKGATEDMLEKLDDRARQFARMAAHRLGYDHSSVPGAGAAGGLGYAFLQYLGASTRSGADLLLDWVNFDRLIADADVVITGEGRADAQTLMGKLPERVLCRAQSRGIPVWLMAGAVSDKERLLEAGFARADGITPDDMPICEALRPEVARENIHHWVGRIVAP